MGFLGTAAGAVIQGVTGLGGAALQARSQGKALEQQAAAQAEALRFQRDQAAKAEAAYRQRYLQNMAMRNALLQRYGISLPEMQQGYQPMPQQPGAVPRGGGLTLAELAMRGKPVGLE